ncbi:MAG TPA: hypothetical protein VL593_15880, partial [Ramlibacter sp.]|nr:hypothetical protein [Ramlibacter sp.]
GERTNLQVEVTNDSGIDWQPSAQSGIYVGNRWVHSDGKSAVELDGRASLEKGLAAGQSTAVELPVTAPWQGGRWLLEIDLVDEGVDWFKERGSKPCLLELNVEVPAVAGV